MENKKVTIATGYVVDITFVKQIIKTHDLDEVNRLIRENWMLLHVAPNEAEKTVLFAIGKIGD